MLRLRRTLGPLMLIFLLCEAESSCTPDLILAKSQVVAAYGETVMINCTTPSDDYNDLYLKTEEMRIEGEVSVTKWDMNVECVIQLEHSVECRQQIGILVYKTPDSVSVSAGEMEEGAANHLSCDVTNVAPLWALRVKWYRDNQTLHTDVFPGRDATPVNISSTLTITTVKEDSLKHFRCQAELHLGPNGPDLIPTVTSSAFTPVVLYKPTIQGCPGRYTGVEHVFSLDRLPCGVDGNPPPTVHWHYEGVEIDASVPLTRTGSGRYTAVAVNRLGRDSTAVNVTVEYAPSFTCKQFYEIEEGAQDQSVCEAEGVPPPVIAWIKDGVAIATPPRWTKDDSGNYSLTATNRHGTESHVLYLDVLYKPTIQGCPGRYTGVEHVFSLDRLPCGVDGNPPPTVHWHYEGVEIDASVPLTRTGSGRYTAVAVNRLGRDSTAVNVTVEYAPSFTCKQFYEIEEGAQDQSVCEAEGVPPPVIAWIKDGVAIATPPRWTKDDSGNYSLTATNRHGTESHVLYLDVLYKPTIQGCPGRYTGVEHVFSLDRLPCGVDGNPPPTVHWYFEGVEIDASVPLTRTGSGRYTAVAVNRLGRDSTAVNVTVEYAPAFTVSHADIVVYEGEKVNVSCEADGFPPPQPMWTCDGTNVLETTKYLLIGQVKRSIQCNCTAHNYLDSATKAFNIVVRELSRTAPPAGMTTPDSAPQFVCPVTLSPAEVAVRFGDPLTINCSTSAADVRRFGFEAPFGGKQENQPFSVTWAAEEVREWVVQVMCYVTLDNDQCSEAPRITVYKTPDSVSVSAGVMEEGAANRLSCDVTNVAPLWALRVKWYRDNQTLNTDVFPGTDATPVNVSSTLTITAVKEDSLTHFRCQAELQLGPNGPDLIPTVTSSAFTPVVLYKPTIQGCPGRYTCVEHVFSLDRLPCGVDGNPPPTFQWYFEGAKVNASVPLTRTGSGRYTAVAVNRLGRDSTAVNVTVEYAPSFTCKQFYEIEEDAQDQSVCEAEGVPPPVITWIKDGVAIATPPRWTKDDSGNYSLTATNRHGTESHVLYLDVLYGPVLNLDNYAQEVSPGGSVSLECSAEGNPPPEVDWEYAPAGNAMATTRGRQKSITITGATSTNAGVYICVASSKVGRATRSVTLLMKGKTSPVSAQAVGILLFFIFTFLIVMIIILCRKCKKKNGEYRFVADGASDGPDAALPMTTKHQGLQA